MLGVFSPRPLRFRVREFHNRDPLTIRRGECFEPEESGSGAREGIHSRGDGRVFLDVLWS